MAVPATPRQLQYLAYIHAYSVLHGQPPSEAEIAAYFSVSPPAAHQIVVTLERRGLIGRTPGQARSIRVLLSPAAIPGLHGGRTLPQAEPAAGVAYPHLARWIAGAGIVELGRTEHGGSMARAAGQRDRVGRQGQLPESG